MTYSSRSDLANLIDAVRLQNKWEFSSLTFYGSGLNDLSLAPTSEQGFTDLTTPQNIVIQVWEPAHGVGPDRFRFSWNNGATWVTDFAAIPESLLVSINNGVFILWGTNVADSHKSGDWWRFTATPVVQVGYMEIAHDWLNTCLERTHDVPFSSPSTTVKLAEATYAIYLILRRDDDPRYAEYYAEAYRLVDLLTNFRVAGEVEKVGKIPVPVMPTS